MSGTVSLQIKNPEIEEWEWAYESYRKLKEWKRIHFDKQLEMQMGSEAMVNRLLTDAK